MCVGCVTGFGCVQQTGSGVYHVGPVFADSPAIGKILLITLFHSVADGRQVRMYVPANSALKKWLMYEFGLEVMFETRRMYTKEKVALNMDKVFALTAFMHVARWDLINCGGFCRYKSDVFILRGRVQKGLPWPIYRIGSINIVTYLKKNVSSHEDHLRFKQIYLYASTQKIMTSAHVAWILV